MGKKIYFDCVQEFDKYGEDNLLEKQIHKDILELSPEETLEYCIDKCSEFIRENNDLKVCLGIIFNYCPSKYHPYNDYELTAAYIALYAKNMITRKELNKILGLYDY